MHSKTSRRSTGDIQKPYNLKTIDKVCFRLGFNKYKVLYKDYRHFAATATNLIRIVK